MKWISVEDELPARYIDVLIYPLPEFSDEYRYVGEYDPVRGDFTVWVGSFGCYEKVNVTHWQPLSEPPKVT